MATSTAQTIPLIEVYDYYLAPGDPASGTTSKGKTGRTVKVTLQYDKALTIAPDAVVWAAQEAVYSALTDANGFWRVFLVPNNKISPANTYYTVEIEGGPSYQIQVTDVAAPAIGWQSSAPGTLLNIPSALAPTTSTVGAITATGLITAQAGISVTAGGVAIAAGGASVVGGLTVDSITYSQAVSRLIPGGTSFSVRDTANANDNLLVTNAGLVTVRAGLNVTAGGANITAGDLTVTAGNLVMAAAASRLVPGATSFSIRDTANANDNLLVSNAGNATVRGSLTVTGGPFTLTAGNLNVTAGNLVFAAASAKIIPGATSLLVRNTADSASQMSILDSGAITLRNALSIPTSQDGSPAATSFGTVPVKFAETLLGVSTATITFSSIPATFRHLKLDGYARSDTAALNTGVLLRENNDSAANYDYQVGFANGATTFSVTETLGATSINVGQIPANTATANFFGQFEARIKHYAGTTGNKQVVSQASWGENNSTTTAGRFQVGGGKWRTTATAVNRLDLITTGNFIAGTFVSLQLEP